MVSGLPGSISGMAYDNPLYEQYFFWLSSITNNFTKYPTLIPLDEYFYFLEGFKTSYPEYGSNTNFSLHPDALMNAIMSSDCPK
jgi:hypothetical protein